MLRTLMPTLLALAGCRQVLGLDDLATVHGTLRIRTVRNDANFEPLTSELIVPAAGVVFRAVLDNGVEPVVDYDETTGTFSFVTSEPGMPYRIVWEAAELALRGEVQHDAQQLAIGAVFAGRFEAGPLARTTFRFDYPISPARPALVASTGVYSLTDTGRTGPSIDFDWRQAKGVASARVGQLDSTAYDRIYVLEPELVRDDPVPPWQRIRSLSTVSVTARPETTSVLPDLQTVQSNTCAHLVVEGEAADQRVQMARPRTYSDRSLQWQVQALPAVATTAQAGAIWVASATITDSSFDVDAPLEFHNPLPGTLVGFHLTYASFDVRVGTAAPLTLSNATASRSLLAITDSTACNPGTTTLASTVAIASSFALDGAALTADNQALPQGTGPATLTWSDAVAGSVDHYAVSLIELVDDAGSTTSTGRWSAVTPYRQVTFDRALLVAGKTYVVAVSAATGRRGFADGDYMSFSLPAETSTIYSTTFTIAP